MAKNNFENAKNYELHFLNQKRQEFFNIIKNK